MSVVGRSAYGAAVDQQRSTSVASVSQGPVLAAWGVVGERPQFPSAPFPDMPPAAAAAVSPVVPGAPAAAAPPDPYGRCWQNQVDAGACFPYFGTLYGSSLPPPSYRMQPGCMSNLGQFWPPTPPPDGCVRYDGSNNLHFCSPLTPMFRHSESLPQTMLGVHHQRLGHYSHLIDVNKDAGLKRLDACIDNVQRQKVTLPSKHSKDIIQQKLCHCYECNEKTTHSLTPSINKENIGRSVEQRFMEEKFKSKTCKKPKDESIGLPRTVSNFHPNSSAITGYSCSVDQNTARTISAMQSLQAQDTVSRNYQKSDTAIVTSSGHQYEFAHPNSTTSSGIRCGSNSVFTVPSSNAISPVVSTTIKCSEQSRYDNVEKAQQRRLPTASIPGFDSYSIPPVQTPTSSHAHHPNDKSCCFSPPYLSSRTLYPSHSENYAHNKTPNAFVIHGNNYNASPLKNVYFSYYESENFDLASDSNARKHSRSSLGKQEKVSGLSYVNNNRSPSEKPIDYLASSTTANGVHSLNPALSNSYSYRTPQKMATTPINIHGPLPQAMFLEPHKTDANFCNYLGTTSSRKTEKSAFSKQLGKTNSAFIKQEKIEAFDCKFQKSSVDSNLEIPQLPVPATANEVLNLSTSLRCPKIEPNDTHYNEASNLITEGYHSSPFSTSIVPGTMSGISIPTVTCKSAEPVTNRSNDVTSNYSSNIRPFCGIDKTYGIQDATSLRMHRLENQCAPAVPEDLVSVGQVAPTVDELVILNTIPPTGSEAPLDVMPLISMAEAEKNDTASKPPQESSSSLVAVQPMESADIGQYVPHPEECQIIAPQQRKKECDINDCFSDCDASCLESCLVQDKMNCNSSCVESCPSQDRTNCDMSCKESCLAQSETNCDALCKDSCLSPEEGKASIEDPKLADVAETIDLVKIKAEKLLSNSSIESQNANMNISQGKIRQMPSTNEIIECKGMKLQETVLKEQVMISNMSVDVSGVVKTEPDIAINRPNECHGLYLLLQGIDQQCNIEDKDVKEEVLDDIKSTDCAINNDETEKGIIDTSKSEATSMKGLNLLCALVEEQFAKEFGQERNCKMEEIKEELLSKPNPLQKTEKF